MAKIKPFRAPDPHLREVADKRFEKDGFLDQLFTFASTKVEPPYSFSVNGNWGSGKTSLLLALQKKFQENDYPVFWFNPWEYERAEDILYAFLFELSNFAKNQLGEIAKELILQIATLGVTGVDLLARLITNNKLTFKNTLEITKEMQEAFEGRYEQEDLISIFKKDFASITEKLANKHEGRPLIVFIDDLDRCLPERALDMLDAIKNLFLVKGAKVLFFSGIDSNVAQKFIQKRYDGMDANYAQQYFKKVFNFTLNVPQWTLEDITPLILERLEELYPEQPKWLDGQRWEEQKGKIAQQFATFLLHAGIKSIRLIYNIIDTWYFAIDIRTEGAQKHKVIFKLAMLKEVEPEVLVKIQKRVKAEPNINLFAGAPYPWQVIAEKHEFSHPYIKVIYSGMQKTAPTTAEILLF